jgi:hypothetical protein
MDIEAAIDNDFDLPDLSDHLGAFIFLHRGTEAPVSVSADLICIFAVFQAEVLVAFL